LRIENNKKSKEFETSLKNRLDEMKIVYENKLKEEMNLFYQELSQNENEKIQLRKQIDELNCNLYESYYI